MTAATAAPAPAMPALSTRVGPLEGVRQSGSLAWRTVQQVRNDPKELAGLSFQPIIFTLLFTYVFGGAIGGSRHTYLQFMIPGMLAMSMLFTTLFVGQGLNTDLARGVFDRLRSLPIARWAPMAGRILGDQLKQVWVIVLVVAVGSALGFRPHNGYLGVLGAALVLLVFALAFSWISVLVGLTAKNAESVQVFGMAVVLPLNFVSGVFAPTETMPGWIQAFDHVSPVANLLRTVRGLINGGPVAEPLFWTMVWAVVLVVVFGSLSLRAFKRKA
jgi:ABC-2 type transport system permease protein/oleandomycin transport system permease protein